MLLLAVAATINANAGCCITNARLDCGVHPFENCIQIQWMPDYDCEYSLCTYQEAYIYRRCGTDGEWQLIITDPQYAELDCPGPGCSSDPDWYYKIELYCYCNGEVVRDEVTLGPIQCPPK